MDVEQFIINDYLAWGLQADMAADTSLVTRLTS